MASNISSVMDRRAVLVVEDDEQLGEAIGMCVEDAGYEVAGVVSARFTSRSWAFAGVRQLVLGVASAAIAYGVGALFGAAVG